MENITSFFNELKAHAGAIWLEENTLHFSAPKKFQNQEINDFIKKNKNEIISVLKENAIFSTRTFFNTVIWRNNSTMHFPLSSAQERLWFVEQYEEGSNAYHIPTVYELDTDTDIEGIKHALQQIVKRHEVLRSTIDQRDDQQQAIQIIHNHILPIEEITLTETDDYISFIKYDINHPFDLNNTYPIRVKLYTIQSDKNAVPVSDKRKILLLINIHHIASDAWSMGIFQKELFAYYEAYINNDINFNLRVLEIQYKDYALWQKTYLKGESLKDQLNYWKNKLSGYQNLELPTDYPRPNKIDYNGAHLEFTLSNETSEKLRKLSQYYGITLHSVMLSSIAILLGKYTGQNDIVIGSSIANRHHRQTEELIGFFVNMQAHRILLNKFQSYETLIQEVYQEQIKAQLHQDIPFEKLVDELRIERDTSRHPVFQVAFGVRSYGNESSTKGQQKKYLRPYLIADAYEVEKFDLSVYIDDSEKELKGVFSYATSLFSKDTITRLIHCYNYLLDQLAKTPDKPYSQIGLLRPEEYEQIIYEWNETDQDYPKNKTIDQLFEEQVKKTPDNIALIYEEQQLTYHELNEKSNQLARYIRAQYKNKTKQSLTPDTLIVLCMDRSIEMLIGILAVLKAGGAYVPMNPMYPQARIDYVLDNTRTALILSQKSVKERSHPQLPQDKVINIDLTEDIYTSQAKSNLSKFATSGNLAYVIYTSGTTGKPAGVMVEHSSAIYYLFCFKQLIGKKHLKICSVIDYCFDMSLPTLLSGTVGNTTTYIGKTDLLIEETLQHYIKENKINAIRLTPSILELLDLSELEQELTIVMGGEKISFRCVNNLLLNKNIILHNQYGPTECTVGSTVYAVDQEITQQLIGKGYPGKKIYVLDSNRIPVPIGVIGELYIGGASLSRGYLNRSDLTLERFVSNPFASESDKKQGYTRLYKTGDLVRWLADGNLEYIGRNDEQVKIRGYRIELGEIASVLSGISGIKQSCVVVKEKETATGRSKYLVGYYLLDKDSELVAPSAIGDKLMQVLPAFMIPDYLIPLETFPLTINGKLDKRALPDPDFTTVSEGYVSPVNKRQEEICNIWQQVLGLDRVGIKDDFFRIGGNSILAIQVSHRMSKALGYDVKVADVFKHKSISQLLGQQEEVAGVTIPCTGDERSLLSFAQERLWFIEQYEEGTNAYHIPEVYEIERGTDVAGIKYALQQIVKRHEVLRSILSQEEGADHGLQVVQQAALLIKEILVKPHEGIEQLIKEEINRPFDLSKEYPIRVVLYRLSSSVAGVDERIFLLITTHHIASDGWSMGIFHRELDSYYQAHLRGEQNFSLPPLEIQYKDYAQWQRSYLTGSILEKQINYWKERLKGYEPLELPTDYARPSQINYKGSYEGFILSKKVSQKLRALCRQQGATMHSVLLSSLSILLSKYSGQQDIIIGSPIANRHHRQTEGLIGFFVNTQVNRVQLEPCQSYQDLIQQVQQQQVEAQLHQDLPFEKLVDELKVERDGSRHPVFQVMFGVQNFGNENKVSDQQVYLRPYELQGGYEVEKFDLSVFIDDGNEELSGQISYATSLFHPATISRLIDHYIHLLEQLSEAPDQPYSRMSLLTKEEYNQIVHQWNNTHKEYEKDTLIGICLKSIHQEASRIAVIDHCGSYSYDQIGAYSYHIGGYLHDKGLSKRNSLVAVLSEKGYQQVVSSLGIMQSGGAYLPLHVEWPLGRIKEVLEEGLVETVLVSLAAFHTSIKSTELESAYRWLIIEEIIHYQPQVRASHLPKAGVEDIAYVIFTSGSTGKPKGVTIPHQGAVNTIYAVNDAFKVTRSDKVLALSELSFDLSVYDIFGLLAAGGTVVFPEQKQIKAPEHWYSLIKEHGITLWDTVPQLMQLLVDYVKESNQPLMGLRAVLMSGDWIPIHLPSTIRSLNKEIKIMSLGGATEGSIWSIWYDVKEINPAWHSIPYGQAMPNQKMYILDSEQEHCGVGIKGGIYIGGQGVALGYWNDQQRTNKGFIIHKKLGRLYNTGDLGKWKEEGYIEFMGRMDEQVKIHGYRMELGEIEHAFLQIKGIKQAHVLVKERKSQSGQRKYLVGYYVLDKNGPVPSLKEIKEKLSQVLPEYMVPVFFVTMDLFPLSSNGKLDKGALPSPDFNASQEDYAAPQTAVEKEVVAIWESILGLDGISVTEDFFRIGGDSILSIQVSSRLRQWGYSCQVKDIFEYKTVRGLSAYLSKKRTEKKLETEQGILTGQLALLPCQQWFSEKVNTGDFSYPHHWNQSFLIRVPKLQVERLAAVIEELVRYHDVFRIRYDKKEEGNWKQYYQEKISLPPLRTLDISKHREEEVEELLTSWQSGFDLEQGPLYQAGYLYGYEDGSARIYMAMHHLIVDGVSWRILSDDIRTLYEGSRLPAKSSSYRQWAACVKQYVLEHRDESAFWQLQVNAVAAYDIKGKEQEQGSAYVELDKEQTSCLLQQCPQAYHTSINDLLLTGLAYALKSLNQQDIQVITLEGHGREDIDENIDHSRTVGWYTTLYPVKLELQKTLGESIQFIKESLRQIPGKGIGFGAFATSQETKFTHKDLASVSFNYLGQFDIQQGDWQIVAESSGTSMHLLNKDGYVINMNGMVDKGKLGFSVVTRLGAATTRQLSEDFKKQITNIIEHCIEKLHTEGSTFTPSDFKDFIPYEIINDHLHDDPIFIFPPGDGGAESYYSNIVPKLKNKKLVLFNNYYDSLNKKEVNTRNYTIEKLAAYYKIYVRKLQPKANYTFLGWSFGGVLAFEVLRQLSNEKNEINNLVLLDSYFGYKDAGKYFPNAYVNKFKSKIKNNINYLYNPKFDLSRLNITLFKVRSGRNWENFDAVEDVKIELQSIEKFYLETMYNGLDKIHANSTYRIEEIVRVIKLDCNHSNILETNSELISNCVLSIQNVIKENEFQEVNQI